MKVIYFNNQTYYLKISIKKFIAINQLGLIEKMAYFPTTLDYLQLCSIIVDEYGFNEDELYDFMDFIVEDYGMSILLEELLIDSGLASNNDDITDEVCESTNTSNNDINDVKTTENHQFVDDVDLLLRDCLAFGMDVETFYNMSLKEVNLFILGIQQKQKNEQQTQAYFDYTLASLITRGTSTVLGGKGKFPKFEEVYSSILGEQSDDELVLEGYADGVTPVYQRKVDVEHDDFRKQLIAIQAHNQIVKTMRGDGEEC